VKSKIFVVVFPMCVCDDVATVPSIGAGFSNASSASPVVRVLSGEFIPALTARGSYYGTLTCIPTAHRSTYLQTTCGCQCVQAHYATLLINTTVLAPASAHCTPQSTPQSIGEQRVRPGTRTTIHSTLIQRHATREINIHYAISTELTWYIV